MAHTTLVILVLLIGGFIGWGLFVFTIRHICHSRRQEMKMINDIVEELRSIRNDVKDLLK
jgi:hypothetical protein